MTRRKYEPHPVEARVRASIAAGLTMTGEPNVAIAEIVYVGDPMIGRRQRGLVPWSLADLGRLADHWRISPEALLIGPDQVLAELPAERVAELRRARGLPALPARDTGRAAA